MRDRGGWPTPPPRRESDVVIALAILAIGAVGFMFGWLFRRGGALAGAPSAPQGGGGGNVTNIWNVTAPPSATAPGLPAPAAVEAALGAPAVTPIPVNVVPRVPESSSVNHNTYFQTLTVGTRPVVLYTAPPERYYTLQVRVVAPPGAFVFVGSSPTAVADASVSGGGAVVIPVGGSNTIRVRPRQPIYVQGNVANTVVSMTASPEVLPSGDETL